MLAAANPSRRKLPRQNERFKRLIHLLSSWAVTVRVGADILMQCCVDRLAGEFVRRVLCTKAAPYSRRAKARRLNEEWRKPICELVLMAKSTPPNPPAGQLDFEEALKRLEQIVHTLEEGDIGLNEALEAVRGRGQTSSAILRTARTGGAADRALERRRCRGQSHHAAL